MQQPTVGRLVYAFSKDKLWDGPAPALVVACTPGERPKVSVEAKYVGEGNPTEQGVTTCRVVTVEILDVDLYPPGGAPAELELGVEFWCEWMPYQHQKAEEKADPHKPIATKRVNIVNDAGEVVMSLAYAQGVAGLWIGRPTDPVMAGVYGDGKTASFGVWRRFGADETIDPRMSFALATDHEDAFFQIGVGEKEGKFYHVPAERLIKYGHQIS